MAQHGASNKNMNALWKTAYDQVASPSAGTTMVTGKSDVDPAEANYQAKSVARSGKAKDLAGKEQVGAEKRALDAQLGRGDKSMSKTGGRLGDATAQPNTGVNDGWADSWEK